MAEFGGVEGAQARLAGPGHGSEAAVDGAGRDARWENSRFGQPNPYGHPDPNALAEAEATGAEIWRTDEHGTLTISWDAAGDPVVHPER
jgi:hypothetical protein